MSPLQRAAEPESISGIEETTGKEEFLLCLQQSERIRISCLNQGQMLSKRILEVSSEGKNHRMGKVGPSGHLVQPPCTRPN